MYGETALSKGLLQPRPMVTCRRLGHPQCQSIRAEICPSVLGTMLPCQEPAAKASAATLPRLFAMATPGATPGPCTAQGWFLSLLVLPLLNDCVLPGKHKAKTCRRAAGEHPFQPSKACAAKFPDSRPQTG